ncbi:MAG: dephospho-CoA kinase [Candidatus Shapirobacteria bacterium]
MNKEINAYGLTGNMGCGKSTVGEFLKGHNDVSVLDCDQISKNILFSDENRQSIKTILGESIIKDGHVDSKEISKIIFNDSTKKQELENFVHPLVWQEVQKQVQNGDKNTIFIVESAIIYETKSEEIFKGVIVATCDEKEQFNRIKKRNNWSEEQIEERLKNQLKNSDKEKKGLVVINTNCSIQELESKVERLYSFVKNNESGRLVL